MRTNFKKMLLVICTTVVMSGCVSAIPSEKILSRSDGLSSTPSWASFSMASFTEGNQVKFIGVHEQPDGQRLTSGCKIAQNKAKGEISSEIEQKLSFIFQHAEEGSEFGSEQTKYIGGEVSKLTASSIHYDGCYWERVAIPSGIGTYDIRYRFFSKISISQQELQRAIRKAGGGRLSAEFSQQVTDHWNEMSKS